MIAWLAVSLVAVFAIRYVTAVQLRSMQRRIETVSREIEVRRGHLTAARENLRRVRSQEEALTDRRTGMARVLADLSSCLRSREEQETRKT